MKKLLALLLVLLGVMSLLFIGCDCDSEEEPPAPTAVVTLDKTELALELGGTATITATYAEVEGNILEYVSADASVVEVDGEGNVTAKKVGTAVITAKYGEATADCTVTVTLGNKVPKLMVDEFSEGVISISKSDKFNFAPYVLFNNGKYDDLTVDYDYDKTYFIIENNVLTPTGTVGESTLKISATWNDRNDAETMQMLVKVKIVDIIQVVVNNGSTVENTLYTKAELAGSNFNTSVPFSITASHNGTIVTPNVEIITGSDLIEYENNQIISLGKSGKAQVKVTLEGVANYEKTFDFNVLKSVANKEGVIDFSCADGTLPLATLFATGETLVGAEMSGETLTVENDKVLGIPYTRHDSVLTEKTLTIYSSGEYGLNITIKPYHKIIKTATDLAFFKYETDTSNTKFDGYYIVANNIDASAYTHASPCISSQVSLTSNSGLTGIFDGQGYTIKGLKLTHNGIFGEVAGGTIKNVAFTNVTFTATGFYNALFGAYMGSATLNNVYVDMTLWNGGAARGALAYIFKGDNGGKNTLTDCLIKVAHSGLSSAPGASGGSLFGNGNFRDNNVISDTWSNVLVVSTLELNKGTTDKTIYDATNCPTEVTDFSVRTLNGTYRYASDELLTSGEATRFADFDTNYWQINGESGMLEFKTAVIS